MKALQGPPQHKLLVKFRHLLCTGKWIEPAAGCNLYLKSYFPVYESNLVEVLNDLSLEDADNPRDKNEG